MNKEHFLALLQDASLGEKEVKNIATLAEKHPYSQPIKALLARSSKGASLNLYKRSVTLAAVSASERGALKEFVETSEKQVSTKTSIAAKPARRKTATKVVKKTSKPASQTKGDRPTQPKATSDIAAKLREEVLHNLEELQKHKSELKELFSDGAGESSKSKPGKKTVAQKKSPEKKAAPAARTKGNDKPKKEPTTTSPASKEKLIDQFIKESPSITPKKKFEGEQEDLAKKSVTMNEDIVSENLAEIFARQGKIKKAEEIYRKLIWKFPQKKAFFASRIEEIKLRN